LPLELLAATYETLLSTIQPLAAKELNSPALLAFSALLEPLMITRSLNGGIGVLMDGHTQQVEHEASLPSRRDMICCCTARAHGMGPRGPKRVWSPRIESHLHKWPRPLRHQQPSTIGDGVSEWVLQHHDKKAWQAGDAWVAEYSWPVIVRGCP